MSLLEKRPALVLGLGGGFLTLAGGASTLIGRHRVDRGERRLEELRSEVDLARRKAAAVPEIERQVVIARETMTELARILPSGKEIHEFVRRLWSFQDESKVRISSLEDRSPRKTDRGGFERVGYAMKLEGNLWQLLAFLARLESYERFVRVPRLQISPGKRPENGREEDVRHTVRLELETFVQPAPKERPPQVEIPQYEAKLQAMGEEVSRARGRIETPVHSFEGAAGRRDPFVDPRLPAGSGSSAGPPTEEQAALVERLRSAVSSLSEEVRRFSQTEDLAERAERGGQIQSSLDSLAAQVAEIEREGRVTYPPVARRFRREVLEPLQAARALFAAQMEARPSGEELEIVLRQMQALAAAGDFDRALDRAAPVAARLPALENDPVRGPRVAEIRALEARVRGAREIARRSFQIQGTIVVEQGSVALIDGRTVVEGELFEPGLLVHRIGEEEVEFLFEDLVIRKSRGGP